MNRKVVATQRAKINSHEIADISRRFALTKSFVGKLVLRVARKL